jgi:hypothetical protein
MKEDKMKKLILYGMVLLFALGITVNANGGLVPGTYDLLTALGNGSWNEVLLGAHGVTGNDILATGPGWALTGELVSVAAYSPFNLPWQYQSIYNIGIAITVPGTWGEAISVSNVSGTNLSKRDGSGKLAWHFTFTGYDTENPSIPIYFTADFDSITPTPLSGVTYYNDNKTLHGGSPLSQLTMQIVPIPAAAWFLGSGLLGLVAIRRKVKK